MKYIQRNEHIICMSFPVKINVNVRLFKKINGIQSQSWIIDCPRFTVCFFKGSITSLRNSNKILLGKLSNDSSLLPKYINLLLKTLVVYAGVLIEHVKLYLILLNKHSNYQG